MRPRSIVLARLWCAAVTTLACGGGDGGGTEPPPPPTQEVATVSVTGPADQPVPGDEVQLVATARDAEGSELTGRVTTWSSSVPAVARVSESGLVTAVAPGLATITATSEGKSGKLDIRVQEGGRIGPEGGIVTGLGGDLRLQVPAGALAAPVSITVGRTGALPMDPSLVRGSGYTLGPTGTTFSAPATLSLRYVTDQGPSGVAESAFRLHRVETGVLGGLGGTVDVGADIATADVSKLGTFAVSRARPEEPCTAPEHRQFDFWLGQWNITTPSQPPGSSPIPSDITLEPGGCAVFENFNNGRGRSINVYDPADAMWHQTFVFANGQILVLVGGLDGEAMVLSRSLPGTPAGSFDRWTWTQLSGGRVRQLQEVSTDGGQTVQPGFDGTYAPR